MRARAALIALTVLTLSGCGGSSSTTAGTTTTGKSTARAHAHQARSTAPKPTAGTYRGPVPILMYHVINDPPTGTPFPELWTPWKTFAATMYALKKAGFHGVTQGAMWAAWHGGPGLPRRPIVISFDDGYLSQSTHARPTLRALGWPGVLNIEGKNIDPKVGLSRHQVRGLIANGWEINAHTLTHPDLRTVSDAQLKLEVAGSRAKIQRIFGVPVDFFCYPAGKYDARAEAAVKAAGYRAATTVDPGIAKPTDDPFALPRIRVNGTDTPSSVVARARGGGSFAAAAGG